MILAQLWPLMVRDMILYHVGQRNAIGFMTYDTVTRRWTIRVIGERTTVNQAVAIYKSSHTNMHTFNIQQAAAREDILGAFRRITRQFAGFANAVDPTQLTSFNAITTALETLSEISAPEVALAGGRVFTSPHREQEVEHAGVLLTIPRGAGFAVGRLTHWRQVGGQGSLYSQNVIYVMDDPPGQDPVDVYDGRRMPRIVSHMPAWYRLRTVLQYLTTVTMETFGIDRRTLTTIAQEDITLNSRPLKVSANDGTSNLTVINNKEQLVRHLKERLELAAEDYRTTINMNDYAIARLPFSNLTRNVILLPTGVQAGTQVTVTCYYFPHYKHHIQYLYLHHYLRAFNYGLKKETRKIADKRVGDFLNEDVRELRKLIETFGGDTQHLDKYKR